MNKSFNILKWIIPLVHLLTVIYILEKWYHHDSYTYMQILKESWEVISIWAIITIGVPLIIWFGSYIQSRKS